MKLLGQMVTEIQCLEDGLFSRDFDHCLEKKQGNGCSF